MKRYVKSIDVDDPDHAYTLCRAGHATYCRVLPTVEQPLVALMLRGTGLGCGHYYPSGTKVSTLGRSEVEVIIGTKTHRKNWYTDFQDNFTLQLSGKKKWRPKQGSVNHPLRGCAPHYISPDSVESQLKAANCQILTFNSDGRMLVIRRIFMERSKKQLHILEICFTSQMVCGTQSKPLKNSIKCNIYINMQYSSSIQYCLGH